MRTDRIFDIDYINNKIKYYDNIDWWRKIVNDNHKNRRKTDPVFKLMGNMRSRLYIAFKKKDWKKGCKTSEILGCTPEEAKIHIESKFKTGMTWENYGKWHIDHIIPLCSAKNEEEIAKLCHYSNLQPLWASDNIRKRGKLEK